VYNPNSSDSSPKVTKEDEMTQMDDMTAPKMTRVTVRVPKTTLDQINEWVDALGVRRSHFLGIALVAGVRSLIRASAVELSLAPEATARPDGGFAPQGAGQHTAELDRASQRALTQTVETLKADLARTRAEVAALREQLPTHPGGRKRP
jgi:hypothetical protein